MTSKAITSFNAGEWSPWLDGRVDLDKYDRACLVAENFLLTQYGGVRRRPGTEYIATLAEESEQGRLLPFRVSTSDTYVLLFNNGNIYVYTGGASPTLIDTLDVATETGTTAYAAADLFDIQSAQQNDVMYLTHPDYPVRKVTRTTSTTFTIEDVDWNWAPMRDVNLDDAVTVAASATTGTGITLTGVGTSWTSSLVGSRMRILHERADTDFEVVQAGNGTSSEILVIGTWECAVYVSSTTVTGTIDIEEYDYDATAWVAARRVNNTGENVIVSGTQDQITRMRITIASAGSDVTGRLSCEEDPYGEVTITAVGGATSATATVTKRLFSTDATPNWSEGAFSALHGYPRTCAFHEGRLVFGGTDDNPQTIWGSRTDDYENFDTGTNDDDSYRHTLAANEHNGIRWMVSERRLLIGTTGGEFVVGSADDSVVITPSNVRARRHSQYGAAPVQPVFVNDSVVFVQRQARKLREYGYSFERDRYQAVELTTLAEHVTGTGVTEIALQQQRDTVVWGITVEGELIGLTYEREQSVVGWHRHVTDGQFESIETIYSDGDEDEVWVVVKRTVNGGTHRYLERLEPNQYLAQYNETRNSWWYVDSGVSTTGSGISTIAVSHLEGETVDLIADGVYAGQATVTGGVATLPNSATASKIIAGLPFVSRLQPMKLNIPMQNGTSRTREGRVNRIGLVVWKSIGGKFGEYVTGDVSALELDPIVFRTTSDDYDTGTAVKTGEFEVDADFDYREGPTLGIVCDQPYPFALLLLVAKMDFFGDNV